MAVKLAQEPARLADLKARIAHSRPGSALFDRVRFTRNLEAAYAKMWERQQRGESPQSFAVDRIDRANP